MASNTYTDMSELIKDYYNMPVGNYLNIEVSINDVSLICDIYRVEYGTVLTSSIFTGCTDVDANTQIIIGMNMSVASGTTLTPPYRCKGLFIGDKGIFTNNGIISMTARGASGAGQNIQLTTDYSISAVGGSANSSPTSGILSCAGGGDGGYYPSVGYMSARGIGGTGTSFSGGSGGGGSGCSNDKAGDGSSTGGAGGNGFCSKSANASGGGGAGNPGGLPDTGGTGTATAGSNGTGGLCVIFAPTIVSTGSLESTGSAGGDASSKTASFASSGGGSGGGCIVLFSSEFNITGTHSVAGGRAGTASGGGAGNPGGNGVYATFIVNDFSLDLDVEFVLTDSTHLDNIDPSDKVRFIGLLDTDEFAYDALGTRHHITPGSGSGGSGVPEGGTTGQILAKKSNVDGDVEWIDNEAGSDVTSEIESLSSLMSELANTVSSESTAQLVIDSTQNNSLNSLSTASSELSSEVAIIGSEVTVIGSEVADLNSEVANKQDTLTAGPGITISGTTISANARTSFEIVNTLPSTDISTTTIYLTPKSDTDTNDFYDEWAYINNAWEHLGNTKIDLTNYYNKTQIDNKFTAQSSVDSAQTSRINSLSMSASETARTVSSILSSQSMYDSCISSLSIENSLQTSEINSLSLLDHTSSINSLSTAESELSSEFAELGSELDTKQDILAIEDEEGTSVPNRSGLVFQEPLTVDDDSTEQKTMIGVDASGELDMSAFVAPSHLSQGINRLEILDDVGIILPTDGQGLKYNGTTQKWINGDVGVSEIELLDDVAISNPTNGQILAYNTTTQKWTNKSDGTILTQTLAANATEVTFTNIPTTGTNLFSLYTNKAGLEYLTVNDSVSGQLTYTFEKQDRSVTVYLVIKEV